MIFLDNNSTTRVDDRVIEAMMPYLTEKYGNPHSEFHKIGLETRNALESSRRSIGNIFDVESEGVIFTSGATESNNMYIKGVALKARETGNKRNKIFCSAIEHKCVLEACFFCRSLGFEVELIPVGISGKVDMKWLEENVDDTTLLISVMGVNNETGLRTNLEEISQLCLKRGVLFHSDLVQALHGECFNFSDIAFDAVSISGHKIHGPKGVGALICSSSPSDIIIPTMHGGLQEQEVKSGTVPVFLSVGLSKALEILIENHKKNKEHILKLRRKFIDSLKKGAGDISINFEASDGHPGTLNVAFRGVEADVMCARLGSKVAVSATAACSGVNFEYSHVLQNMGISTKVAKSSIRLCFSKYNDLSEVETALDIIVSEYQEAKALLLQ